MAGRLKRLRHINKIHPFSPQFYGSNETFRIYHEAIQCYVFGQFIATLILTQSFIERRFQEYFHIRMDDLRSKATLNNLLKEFRQTNFIDDFFIEKINKIRLKRNPFVHHKEPLHPDSLIARSLEASFDPDELLAKDAKEAIEVMIQMGRLRIL